MWHCRGRQRQHWLTCAQRQVQLCGWLPLLAGLTSLQTLPTRPTQLSRQAYSTVSLLFLFQKTLPLLYSSSNGPSVLFVLPSEHSFEIGHSTLNISLLSLCSGQPIHNMACCCNIICSIASLCWPIDIYCLLVAGNILLPSACTYALWVGSTEACCARILAFSSRGATALGRGI